MQNLFFVARNFLRQEMSRISASLFLATTLAVLSGCGGGGGGGSDTGAGPGLATTTGATTTGTTGTTPGATGTSATTGGATTGTAGTTPGAAGTSATTGGTTTGTTGTTPGAAGTSAATGETTGTAGTASAATGPSATTGATTTGTGQSLSVRLTSDLTLVSLSSDNNAKQYNAIVTDSGGHPVPGTEVRFAVRPGHYYTGRYSAAPETSTSTSTDPVTGVVSTSVTSGRATQTITAQCANEDTDFSGIYDAGKDSNQNGVFDPGIIKSNVSSATTDANGIAIVRINYPKSHATWVQVMVEARIGGVNDIPALAAFILPGLIQDYEFGGAASLASVSPYGAIGAPPACITLP